MKQQLTINIIVNLNINILSSFTHPQVVPNLYACSETCFNCFVDTMKVSGVQCCFGQERSKKKKSKIF